MNALLTIAFTFLAINQASPAAKIKIIEETPNSSIISYFLALKGSYEHVSGSHQKAAKTYTDLATMISADNSLDQMRLKLAFDSGRYQEIINQHENSTQSTPLQKEMAFMLAQSYFFTQKDHLALDIFEILMQKYPSDDRFPYFAALTYTKNNNDQKAKEIIEKALAQQLFSSKHYLFHFLKARLAMMRSDQGGARQEINLCLKQNPSFSQGFLLRATLEEKEHNYHQALASFEHYFALQPKAVDIVSSIVRLAIKTKNYRRAQELLAAHKETNIDYFNNKALLHLAHKEYSNASEIIDQGLEIYPNSSILQNLKITLMVTQGDFKQLSTTLTSWLIKQPTNITLIRHIMSLRKKNMPTRILITLLEETACQKQTWQLCFALGDIMQEQGDYKKSRQWYHRALVDESLVHNSLIASQLHYQIAGSYYSEQKYNKAFTENRKALACKPHCPEADALTFQLAQYLPHELDTPIESEPNEHHN